MTAISELGLPLSDSLINWRSQHSGGEVLGVYPNSFDSKEGFYGAVNRIVFEPDADGNFKLKRRLRIHNDSIEITGLENAERNGFSETTSHTILNEHGVTHFFEGHNYAQGVALPKGTTVYLLDEITENATEYIRLSYRDNRISGFGFSKSHYSDKGGKFTGKTHRLTNAAAENIVEDSKFSKLYSEGIARFKKADGTFVFSMNPKNNLITFKIGGLVIARFPSELPDDYGKKLKEYLVPIEVWDKPRLEHPNLQERWRDTDLLDFSPLILNPILSKIR